MLKLYNMQNNHLRLNYFSCPEVSENTGAAWPFRTISLNVSANANHNGQLAEAEVKSFIEFEVNMIQFFFFTFSKES